MRAGDWKFAGIIFTVMVVAVIAANWPARYFVGQIINNTTDRNLINLEIAAKSGKPPLPVMRLRLERAYASYVLHEAQTDDVLVGLIVDMPTGLPANLFNTHSNEVIERFDKASWLARSIMINIASRRTDFNFEKRSSNLNRALGKSLGNDLFEYDVSRDPEGVSGGHKNRMIAITENNNAVMVQCDPPEPANLGCTLRYFPFAGFLIEITFNEFHLPRWRKMIEFAEQFLRAKEIQI